MGSFATLTPEEKTELWACLALRHCPGLGVLTANLLIDHYGSAFEAVELGRRACACWVEDELVSERTARHFTAEEWREKALQEWLLLQQPERDFVFLYGPGYPKLLGTIADVPLVLYCRGDLDLLQAPMVGIVGSRDCTEEGIRVTAFFAQALAEAGVTIVSGMAKGIDRAAHISGLRGLGRSVAVLGTGIDVTYPQSNDDLEDALAREGLIISEFLPGTPPNAKHFPVRNRIISGLSRGVLVVEASKRSGSLITARLALEQGRDVFAVPGHTLSTGSEGCRTLIRQGAKPAFAAEDILLELASLLAQDVCETLQGYQPAENSARGSLPTSISLAAPFERAGKPPLPPLVGADGFMDQALPCPPAKAHKKPAQHASAQSTKRPKGALALPARKKPAISQKKPVFTLPGGLSVEEGTVLRALEGKELHIDTLCQQCELPVSQVSTLLVLLEMRGLVRHAPGMRYSLP